MRRRLLLAILVSSLSSFSGTGCSDSTGPSCRPNGQLCVSDDQCCAHNCVEGNQRRSYCQADGNIDTW